MIRRTVLTSPAGRRASRGAAIPVPVWPQTALSPLSTRWSITPQPKAATQLPVDVFATAEEAVIRAALSGVHPDEIEVSVFQNTVTISAQLPNRNKPEADRVTWLVAELGTGSFQRTIRLPFEIDEQLVEAQFANGMLQLVLPKVEAEKPHQIPVQVRTELNYELESGVSEEESFAAD